MAVAGAFRCATGVVQARRTFSAADIPTLLGHRAAFAILACFSWSAAVILADQVIEAAAARQTGLSTGAACCAADHVLATTDIGVTCLPADAAGVPADEILRAACFAIEATLY